MNISESQKLIPQLVAEKGRLEMENGAFSDEVPRPKSSSSKQLQSLKLLSLKLNSASVNQPLYVRVRHMLRERALQDFQHGQQFYSERELMDEVHASQPTIRRALKDLIDEGYLLADPRRGYFVRHHADVRYVGNISTAYSANSYGERPTEFAAPCREKNLVLLPYYVESTDTVSDILRMIRNKPTEERFLLNGLSMELTLELGAQLQIRGYRHLLIGPPVPGFSGLSIFPDQDQEVDQILDHLTKLNHERIIFLANESKSLTITKLRAEAVERKLKQRDLSQAHLIWCQTSNWNSSFEAAYTETRELFQRKPRPTAIVPLSGIGAWAVLRYAYEHKIDVPQQLSVVSFDPIINAHVHAVPLTEMTYSMTACARIALDLLWSDSVVPAHTTIPAELIVRGSSGLAP